MVGIVALAPAAANGYGGRRGVKATSGDRRGGAKRQSAKQGRRGRGQTTDADDDGEGGGEQRWVDAVGGRSGGVKHLAFDSCGEGEHFHANNAKEIYGDS